MTTRLVRTLAGACVAALAFAGRAGAQTVKGTIVDSATRRPVEAVTVALIDENDPTNRISVMSDSAGGFTFHARRPGTYFVTARRLGYVALATPPRQLDTGSVRTIRFEITRLAIMLDTVRAEAKGGFQLTKLTPGSELFARHYREGKGFFTSGVEILLSHMDACDYISEIPGLMQTQVLIRGETGLRCRGGTYIVNKVRPSCMQTILDRRWRVTAIDSAAILVRTIARSGGSSSEVDLSAVRGIEIYRGRSELPHDTSYPQPTGSLCTTILIWTVQTW